MSNPVFLLNSQQLENLAIEGESFLNGKCFIKREQTRLYTAYRYEYNNRLYKYYTSTEVTEGLTLVNDFPLPLETIITLKDQFQYIITGRNFKSDDISGTEYICHRCDSKLDNNQLIRVNNNQIIKIEQFGSQTAESISQTIMMVEFYQNIKIPT